jgi:glutamate formiminotransferase
LVETGDEKSFGATVSVDGFVLRQRTKPARIWHVVCPADYTGGDRCVQRPCDRVTAGMRLIECVPNVSEGRRPAVIAECADAVRAAGVNLLDVSSDTSHNRTVLTFVGDHASVADAVLALFGCAVAHIDLRTHTGVHPRIGAVDVTPFVPLGRTTMRECVTLARRVGEAIARRFSLPVFLYEAAATTSSRSNLANLRRGQFEGLVERLADPLWAPDFGPRAPHPTAGAAVVGARGPLIAYNVNLATQRLDVAKRIAAAIRESSGGLRCVKALGVPLTDRGLVQVTINLTDFRVTSLHEVFARVSAEAQRYGVEVAGSEIVGLVPAAALSAAAIASLKLHEFTDARIIEYAVQRPPGWLC